MKEYATDFKNKYITRFYLFMLALTAAFGYGFKVMHPAMGIDDTPYKAYFEDGLAAVVGRWVMFLLNKVFHISDFAPFLTDFAGVLLLMAAVTVWAFLFYSVFQEKIPACGYWVFACIFLSSPLISEVFTYYLHNGIAVGYLTGGVSLCLFREGLFRLEAEGKEGKKKAVPPLVGALAFLTVSMGCYESFMMVWLTGAMLVFLSERLAGRKTFLIRKLCAAVVMAAVGMVLRSVVINIVVAVFRLGSLQEVAPQRSVGEMLGWMFESGAAAEFAMVLKRIYVMYGVFACAYYPIKVFVLAAAVILLFCLWKSIRQKDFWILLLVLGSFVTAFVLVVIEGKATLYRSAQFLPLICAYGVLLLCYAMKRFKASRVLFALIAAVLVWNQCEDFNKWFYLDCRKYEYAKEMVTQIAYALEEDYDTDKPVLFTGEWTNPKSLIADAYVDYNSKTFYRMKSLTDPIDEHLLDKFYRDYGVWVAQTPALSVIDWGRYAFGNDEELVRFFAFHGYEIVPFLDETRYEEAEIYSLQLPKFPQNGSIVDMGDYIIVHL